MVGTTLFGQQRQHVIGPKAAAAAAIEGLGTTTNDVKSVRMSTGHVLEGLLGGNVDVHKQFTHPSVRSKSIELLLSVGFAREFVFWKP